MPEELNNPPSTVPLSPRQWDTDSLQWTFTPDGRAILQPGVQSWIVVWLMVLAGMATLALGTLKPHYDSMWKDNQRNGSVLGLVFIVGAAVKAWYFRYFTFDRQAGWCWHGRSCRRRASADPAARLDDVVALQLLGRRAPGSKPGFTRYELNLVLRDPPGGRLRVAQIRNKERILRHIRTLAVFLGKPLWDTAATEPSEEQTGP